MGGASSGAAVIGYDSYAQYEEGVGEGRERGRHSLSASTLYSHEVLVCDPTVCM